MCFLPLCQNWSSPSCLPASCPIMSSARARSHESNLEHQPQSNHSLLSMVAVWDKPQPLQSIQLWLNSRNRKQRQVRGPEPSNPSCLSYNPNPFPRPRPRRYSCAAPHSSHVKHLFFTYGVLFVVCIVFVPYAGGRRTSAEITRPFIFMFKRV